MFIFSYSTKKKPSKRTTTKINLSKNKILFKMSVKRELAFIEFSSYPHCVVYNFILIFHHVLNQNK